MKFYKLIAIILIVFLKLKLFFSENDLFNVNNIQLEKDKISQNELTDLAIKTGFNQLIEKILLKDDSNKLSNLSFTTVKKLVSYYQITEISGEKI